MRRTRNAVCPLDIGGSNPSLSAKQMNENKNRVISATNSTQF
jgi:hypothetical protein